MLILIIDSTSQNLRWGHCTMKHTINHKTNQLVGSIHQCSRLSRFKSCINKGIGVIRDPGILVSSNECKRPIRQKRQSYKVAETTLDRGWEIENDRKRWGKREKHENMRGNYRKSYENDMSISSNMSWKSVISPSKFLRPRSLAHLLGTLALQGFAPRIQRFGASAGHF